MAIPPQAVHGSVDAGTIARIVAPVGSQVEAKDLLIELKAPEPGT